MSGHTNNPRLARDALVLGPSAALNRDPTSAPGVDNTPQAVPQLRVPQQPAAPQPPHLVSRSGQLQDQGFSVEVTERIADPIKWALFEKWCRENSVDFSTPSVKQTSDFFMYLYQDLNRRRENSVDFSTPSVKQSQISSCICTKTLTSAPPPLMVTGLPLLTPWAHRTNILLIMRTFIGCSPISTGTAPKVPEISPSGTFLSFSMSSQSTL